MTDEPSGEGRARFVVERDRERIQVFEGTVLRVRKGYNGSFTVRRISSGVGVERTFPLNGKRVDKVEVTRRGRVRRSRLYYLRVREARRRS